MLECRGTIAHDVVLRTDEIAVLDRPPAVDLAILMESPDLFPDQQQRPQIGDEVMCRDREDEVAVALIEEQKSDWWTLSEIERRAVVFAKSISDVLRTEGGRVDHLHGTESVG